MLARAPVVGELSCGGLVLRDRALPQQQGAPSASAGGARSGVDSICMLLSEVNGQAMHPLSLSRLRASLKCVLPRWAGPKDLELDSLPPFLGTDRDDHGHRGSQARDAGHRGGQEEEANAACMHTQVFFQVGAGIRMCSLHVGSS